MAQKLHRVILLHFLLVTFRFMFGKTREIISFVFSDLADVTMTPNTNYLQLWRHQSISNNSRKAQPRFCKSSFWKSQNDGNLSCGNVGKDGNRLFLKIRLMSPDCWWLWDQYLSKHILELGNFETSKLVRFDLR